MPRLEQLSEVQRNTALMFPCLEHDTAPVTPLKGPLSQSKVALVTTAGLHLRDDVPFVAGDPSYRVIPSNTRPGDILQSHVSIGFDHTSFYRDINGTFPIDRLHELEQRGVIGSVSKNFYSFMGAQRDARKIIETTAPEVAHRLLDEATDVVIVAPT